MLQPAKVESCEVAQAQHFNTSRFGNHYEPRLVRPIRLKGSVAGNVDERRSPPGRPNAGAIRAVIDKAMRLDALPGDPRLDSPHFSNCPRQARNFVCPAGDGNQQRVAGHTVRSKPIVTA
jgi:hypothetical protein